MNKAIPPESPFLASELRGFQSRLLLLGTIALAMVLAACRPSLPNPTASPLSCLGFVVLDDAAHRCQESGNRALLENEAEQITLEGFGASIVVSGQIELERRESSFVIQVIEGSAVVGARGRNRIASPQHSVELPLMDGIAQAPVEILPVNASTSLMLAESTMEILQVEALSTASPEGECSPREDWGQTYTVQAGDNLAEIAEAYDLRIDEIAEANCLADPSRLRIGQILRIAGDSLTATPSAIAFRADSYNLEAGQCTVLRWDVFNVAQVYLDGTETTLNSFLEVCPEETSTYTLRVIFLDGSETERELSIQVDSD